MNERSMLFPALLKHWRRARGLSQLDLSVASGVSSRHISFLETGRAQPSRGMVLRLASTLDVPLRDQNDLLRAADLEEAFAEPTAEDALQGPLGQAVDRMMKHHEPYPMWLLDRRYDIVRTNDSATRMFMHFIRDPSKLQPPFNALELLFDPDLARDFVVNWQSLAQLMMARLHREVLHKPRDTELLQLQEKLQTYEGVPKQVLEPDISSPAAAQPTFTLELKRDDLHLSFFGTVTVFNAPQNVTLEELFFESYFPLDKKTETYCSQI